jgi:hypothetical protein
MNHGKDVADARFNLAPAKKTWHSWSDVEECFAKNGGNSDLDIVLKEGGVYFLAWSAEKSLVSSRAIWSNVEHIKYIGETASFQRRMKAFGVSAGLADNAEKKHPGHSAGWRWPMKKKKDLFVAFFPVYPEFADNYLASKLDDDGSVRKSVLRGYRRWMEALAMVEYAKASKAGLPLLNIPKLEVIGVPDPLDPERLVISLD